MASRRGTLEPRIIPSADCGNSPKNTLLQDIAIAFAKRDADFLSDHVTDDVRWELVGAHAVAGLAALTRALKQSVDVSQLTIEHVMSHGRVGAVNGTVQRGAKVDDFCYVFEFANAKAERVKSIRSYVIARGDA
jgi:ketosteroid isomerase-like protein